MTEQGTMVVASGVFPMSIEAGARATMDRNRVLKGQN